MTTQKDPTMQYTPEPMTEEQVKNYRDVLVGMIGPYAFLMSYEEIQKHRDVMQNRSDQLLSLLEAAS